MGLTDIIPGSGTVKTVGGAILGGAAAGGIVYGVQEYKKKQLSKRLGVVVSERQQCAINRIAVFKHVAWSDGVLHELERLFLFDHIVSCPDLQADVKIKLMLEMRDKPKERKFFGLLPRHYKRENFVASDEEAAGFKSQLYSMANADDVLDEREIEFIDKVVQACGL